MEDLHSSAVEDGQSVVGNAFAGLAEPWFEYGVASID